MDVQMPMRRRFIRESRPLDCFYDPVFTLPALGNRRNGGGDGCWSVAKPTKFRKACFTTKSELVQNQVLYCSQSCPAALLSEHLHPHRIIGTDRAKYFIRYFPEFKLSDQGMIPREIFRGTSCDHPRLDFQRMPPPDPCKLKASAKRHRSMGTQTDFRETETQTDPYTPPYILRDPKEYPKILALTKFTWGNGLPATLEDIVAIERALTRRLLEVSTSLTSDKKQFMRRIKMMEKLEAQQWADRERALENIRKLKQAVLNRQLSLMHHRMAANQTAKLDRIFERKREENAKTFSAIRMKYLRELRKLERKYSGQTRRRFKRDIILDYIDMESAIYAPLTRNGPNVDQLGCAPDYHFTAHHDFETIMYLTQTESFVKDHIQFDFDKFANRIDKLKPNKATLNIEKKLKECYKTFSDAANRKDSDPKHVLDSIIFTGIHRMDTPVHEICVPAAEDEEEEAIILLQSLIRGHYVQQMLRKEARNNMDEILRLKSLWEFDPLGAQQTLNEKLAIINQQNNREGVNAEGSQVEAAAAQLEGEVLFNLMSFLEQEMTRLLDERKVHALMLMAERERRMIEATEAGRRQKEERDLRAKDEIWRQALGVHQQTVDIYLEEIYLEAINRSADDASRRYVRQLATTINDAAHLMEKNLKDMDSQDIAAELVHSFLFPYVVREKHEQDLKALHGRYYSAATQVTTAVLNSQGIVNKIFKDLGPPLVKSLRQGELSVNASYQAVNEMIQAAVQGALMLEKCGGIEGICKKKYPTGQGACEDEASEKPELDTVASGEVVDIEETQAEEGDENAAIEEKALESAAEDEDGEELHEGADGAHTDLEGEEHELPNDLIQGGEKSKVELSESLSREKADEQRSLTRQDTDEKFSYEKIDPELGESSAETEEASEIISLGREDEEDEGQDEVDGEEDYALLQDLFPLDMPSRRVTEMLLHEHDELADTEASIQNNVADENYGKGAQSERNIAKAFDQSADIFGNQMLDMARPSTAGLESGADGDLEDNEEGESDEASLEAEAEESDTSKCAPIAVPAMLPAVIGLKVLELQSGLNELGESAARVYDGACKTVDEFFGVVNNCFESSDDEPDKELDDDDLDLD